MTKKEKLQVGLTALVLVGILIGAAIILPSIREQKAIAKGKLVLMNYNVPQGKEVFGNTTWLPLNIRGKTHNYAQEILVLVEKFREVNPQIEVTGWKANCDEKRPYGVPFINGIWVDHKPKIPKQ